MVQFLNATQTFGEIQSIINQATNRSSIVMISPYIKVNDLILSRLIDAGSNRNVRITMICREDDLKPDERTRLEQIPNLILISDEHVHAKCFYNDECMVIGSLNLYDSTTGINHEMGVLLRNDRESDREAFQAAKNEAQFIMRNAKTHFQQKLEPKPKQSILHGTSSKQNETKIEASFEDKIVGGISSFLGLSSKKTVGHCIHCGIEIPFDTDAPYCAKCWRNWNRYKKRDYSETICHACGHTANTSMNNPLCSSCL